MFRRKKGNVFNILYIMEIIAYIVCKGYQYCLCYVKHYIFCVGIFNPTINNLH